ncbi:MAG: hypothetical protein DMF06_05665 [Verrucomicrobia bacterium]|nr:MAG: hypothetical protein DMF06_05665 [Verrucomicrobiota bacterium]
MGKDENTSAFEKVRGIECLYRYRPTGAYYARFQINGKEVRKSLRTDDRQVAKRALAREQGKQAKIDPAAGKITLASLADRYLKTVSGSQSTIEEKKHVCERVKDEWPEGSTISIHKVVPSQVETFLAQYRFGPCSYNAHLVAIRAMFRMAVADRLLSESPAEHLRGRKRNKPMRLTPTREQFESIIADVRAQTYNADAQDSADFLEFLGRAGLGQAEAAAIKRTDVDLERAVIHTFRWKTRTAFDVPIYPSLRPLVERLLAAPPNKDGRLLRISDAKKALAGACKRLGFPRFSQRSLRRMFITTAIERGADVKVIAEWQGHTDGGTQVLKNYSHVNRAHSDRMAQLM